MRFDLARVEDDLKTFAFPREAGSEGERLAADLAAERLTAAGLLCERLQGRGSVRLRVLRSTLQLAGAWAGADAPWCYVVETDVVPEHESDFNAWYDEEHAPGLAAVPGTVHGARTSIRPSVRRHATLRSTI